MSTSTSLAMAARAGAALDDRAHALELRAVEGAHAELARGALRDDVDGLPAVGDVAVDAHAVAEVDALAVDRGGRCRGRP